MCEISNYILRSSSPAKEPAPPQWRAPRARTHIAQEKARKEKKNDKTARNDAEMGRNNKKR